MVPFQVKTTSVSKSISSTAITAAIAEGALTWETPVSSLLPDFALADPYVTENATVADYFSHRSGLATGAGDDLELSFLISNLDGGWVPSKSAISSYEANVWQQLTDKLVHHHLTGVRVSDF